MNRSRSRSHIRVSSGPVMNDGERERLENNGEMKRGKKRRGGGSTYYLGR